jgi:glutamate 5-kinase
LAVGIRKVKGDFEIGEVVEIVDNHGEMLAVARTKVSSVELTENLKTINYEVANANDIVLI